MQHATQVIIEWVVRVCVREMYRVKLYLQSNADKNIINGNKNKYAWPLIMFSLVCWRFSFWTLPILCGPDSFVLFSYCVRCSNRTSLCDNRWNTKIARNKGRERESFGSFVSLSSLLRFVGSPYTPRWVVAGSNSVVFTWLCVMDIAFVCAHFLRLMLLIAHTLLASVFRFAVQSNFINVWMLRRIRCPFVIRATHLHCLALLSV